MFYIYLIKIFYKKNIYSKISINKKNVNKKMKSLKQFITESLINEAMNKNPEKFLVDFLTIGDETTEIIKTLKREIKKFISDNGIKNSSEIQIAVAEKNYYAEDWCEAGDFDIDNLVEDKDIESVINKMNWVCKPDYSGDGGLKCEIKNNALYVGGGTEVPSFKIYKR